ncbi:MAG TPA: histidine phosphatase family protein [Pseudonocardiaceae bacterium]|nr:histidine phosphatase family protein [Pseudonocardiaceae bacterium]
MTLPDTGTVEYRQPRFVPPAGSTVILLVRHGESAPARPGQSFPMVLGRGDPELAPDGVEQAQRVCARLAKGTLDAIYVTPLRRTQQTAAPLAEATGLTPAVVEDLIEVGLGEWEGGLFRQRVAENHPVAARMWAEERWDVIPGAESSEDLVARTRRAILRIAAEHPDQQVAAFVHGGVIGAILAEAARSRPFAFSGADNGSLSVLVVTPDRWIVRSYNDSSHLEG